MAKKTGLGKGLDSLISTKYRVEEEKKTELSTKAANKVENSVEKTAADAETVMELRLSMIDPNKEQPRKNFNEETLKELAESISTYGVIQPIVVVKQGRRYQIVAGERRFRAARMAGLKVIPAIVREYSSAERTEVAIIENIQRDDLNPVEKALAYRQLLDEFGLTQEDLAKRLAVSRSVIANGIRLLNLSQSIRDNLIDGKISEGHARLLIGLPSALQEQAAAIIIKNGLSVRDTERLIASLSQAKPAKADKKVNKSVDITRLEDELQAMVNTKVLIKSSSAKTGRLLIEYYSLEELDRLIDILRKGSNG